MRLATEAEVPRGDKLLESFGIGNAQPNTFGLSFQQLTQIDLNRRRKRGHRHIIDRVVEGIFQIPPLFQQYP